MRDIRALFPKRPVLMCSVILPNFLSDLLIFYLFVNLTMMIINVIFTSLVTWRFDQFIIYRVNIHLFVGLIAFCQK